MNPHIHPFMRNTALSTAVRLARNLYMPQPCPSSIMREHIVAPASTGRSCVLAFDAHRSVCTVSIGRLHGSSSDQAERLRLDGGFRVLQFFS